MLPDAMVDPLGHVNAISLPSHPDMVVIGSPVEAGMTAAGACAGAGAEHMNDTPTCLATPGYGSSFTTVFAVCPFCNSVYDCLPIAADGNG